MYVRIIFLWILETPPECLLQQYRVRKSLKIVVREWLTVTLYFHPTAHRQKEGSITLAPLLKPYTFGGPGHGSPTTILSLSVSRGITPRHLALRQIVPIVVILIKYIVFLGYFEGSTVIKLNVTVHTSMFHRYSLLLDRFFKQVCISICASSASNFFIRYIYVIIMVSARIYVYTRTKYL